MCNSEKAVSQSRLQYKSFKLALVTLKCAQQRYLALDIYLSRNMVSLTLQQIMIIIFKFTTRAIRRLHEMFFIPPPRKRSLGEYIGITLSVCPASCPEQNFCTVAPRIIKLGMWMHHGKTMCRVSNLGHCDHDFDL